MKIGTVRVSEEFIKPDGTKKWFAHEKQYDQDTEDPLDVFAKAEAEMNAYVKKNNQSIFDNLNLGNIIPPGPPPVITIERTSEAERDAELIRNIYACTQLTGNDGLQTFYTVAQKSEAGKMAYDIMKRKLVKIESDELLAKSKHYNGSIK